MSTKYLFLLILITCLKVEQQPQLLGKIKETETLNEHRVVLQKAQSQISYWFLHRRNWNGSGTEKKVMEIHLGIW